MMEKEWYIKIRGKQQGPFTKDELLLVPGISPDTPVRKIEWNYWLRLIDVEELNDLFESDDKRKKIIFKDPGTSAIDDVLTVEGGPPYYTLWIILILLLLLIYLYAING
jgi:hypothetical protein